MKEIINGVPVIKSGDNFKMFGIIHVYLILAFKKFQMNVKELMKS